MQKLFRFILYRLMGWRSELNLPIPGKYIIALAPHTSNWDFVLGQLFSKAEGVRCQFLMKEEWFRWPLLGRYFRKAGGIPVRRDKHTSLTDQLAALAIESETFALCITPEGTRKPTKEWKRGFYYIAQKADLPILLFGLDYGKKRIVFDKIVHPDGDVERQMLEIKNYYKDFQGKYPENFVL